MQECTLCYLLDMKATYTLLKKICTFGQGAKQTGFCAPVVCDEEGKDELFQLKAVFQSSDRSGVFNVQEKI